MDDNGGDLKAAKTALAQRDVTEDKLLADHNKEADPAVKEVLEVGNQPRHPPDRRCKGQ